MNDRGSALVDTIVAVAVASVVCMAAAEMLVALPARAARWDDESDARQRLRVVEARLADRVAHAAPIVVDVAGVRARVPSLWPRRLGFWRADPPDHVAAEAVTILSRADGHRALTLLSAIGATGGGADVAQADACGTRTACGLGAGDLVLAVSRDSACALFRVRSVGARVELDALMTGGPAFAPGDVLVPVTVTVASFDAGEDALRFYDGYRSDNVLVDGIEGLVLTLEPGEPPVFDQTERGGPFVDEQGRWRGSARLGDGPFAGAGPMSFDIDQLSAGGVSASMTIAGARVVAATWARR